MTQIQKPALPALSSDTARMFDLINKIGTAHSELTKLYEKVYKADDAADEAVYKLQDVWLNRFFLIMRERFITIPMC